MKIKKVKGFLLVEAIISLVITLFCLIMLTNLLALFKQYRQAEHYGNELVLSYVQLNNFIQSSFDIDNQKLKVRIVEQKNGESEWFFDLTSKNKPTKAELEKNDKR